MELTKDIKLDSQDRLQVIRQILREGTAGTQEEICDVLKQKKFKVTQSTVSRDLRRIGAIKMNSAEGVTVYRLPDEAAVIPPQVSHHLGGLLVDIKANQSMIVVKTTPGSASLVARHIDNLGASLGVLGTLAGDDTIFVAPVSTLNIPTLMKKIKFEFLD